MLKSARLKLTAAVVLLFGAFVASSARAQGPLRTTEAHMRHVRMEVLAVSQTKTHKAKRRAKAVSPPVAVRTAPWHPRWTGPDPTRGPGIERLHQLQREGRCVIDEGYGRFTACTNQ